MWQPRSHRQVNPESVPYQIRCKIGNDVVTLSITTNVIRVKADHNFSKTGFSSQEGSKSATATAVLRITDAEDG